MQMRFFPQYLLGRSTTTRLRYVIIVVAVLAGGAACFLIPRNRANQRAELIGCGNYMVAIGFAGRMWANDNGNRFPPDLLSMSNEVISPNILICPGDHSRKPSASWASFTPEQSSFEMVTPSLRYGDTNAVFLRCKIHSSVGYADGSVFVNGKRHRKT
jgi:hypothetical protein